MEKGIMNESPRNGDKVFSELLSKSISILLKDMEELEKLREDNQKYSEMLLHVVLGKGLSEEEKDWVRHHLKK
jgi:hypothetical protein